MRSENRARVGPYSCEAMFYAVFCSFRRMAKSFGQQVGLILSVPFTMNPEAGRPNDAPKSPFDGRDGSKASSHARRLLHASELVSCEPRVERDGT
jgi:hypothetical protein